jgi:hypothetical protein
MMQDLRLELGTIWIVITMIAGAFLGTEFIVNEIRSAIRHHRESGTK